MNHLLLAAASGCVWGAVALALAFDVFPAPIWGGVLGSPLIGLLIGAAARGFNRRPFLLRLLTSLASLYVAASLFGACIGAYDLAVVDSRIPFAVIVQSVLAVLWGLTFSGYVALFWPLAYYNHWLLDAIASKTLGAGPSRPA